MRYYDTLAEYERDGFTVIVDKSWEDIPLRDCFDDSCFDIKDMENKVNKLFEPIASKLPGAIEAELLKETRA